jgi:GTP cyclohydrolase I
MDLAAAERAAAQSLGALGIVTDSEGLRGTPGRMARAYAELFTPRPFDLTTFPNDEGYDALVLARSIPLRSVCEHHLLPFTGTAHVGYLPGGRILAYPNWRGSSSTSLAAPRRRRGSPNRSPTGCG